MLLRGLKIFSIDLKGGQYISKGVLHFDKLFYDNMCMQVARIHLSHLSLQLCIVLGAFIPQSQ